MDREPSLPQSHESVDHDDPSAAGLMDDDRAKTPGTGILGDETLIRDAAGDDIPGAYPAPPSGTGGDAHPGPTAPRPET